MATNNKISNKQNSGQKSDMVFSWSNYKWMLIGALVILVGFILMAGGGSDDRNIFNAEALFSWRRISLAPFMVLVGFGIVGYAIFHKDKKQE